MRLVPFHSSHNGDYCAEMAGAKPPKVQVGKLVAFVFVSQR
jgi:hypothetical protein